MYVKQLFNNSAEYEKWALKLISWCVDNNQSLWEPADLLILEPWFVYSEQMQKQGVEKRGLTDEERAGFDLYIKLRDSTAHKANIEMRDAVQQFDPVELAEVLGLVDLNADDETGELDYNFKLADDFNYHFPVVAVGFIDSNYDRMGRIRMASLDFVEKKMFD